MPRETQRNALGARRSPWTAGGTITLPTTKNGKRRTLHLGGEVAEIVKRREAERLTERDGEPVIASHVFHHHGRQIRDFKALGAPL